MDKLQLRELYLGENDGKKEAVYRTDFERYFIDIDNNFEKLKN